MRVISATLLITLFVMANSVQFLEQAQPVLMQQETVTGDEGSPAPAPAPETDGEGNGEEVQDTVTGGEGNGEEVQDTVTGGEGNGEDAPVSGGEDAPHSDVPNPEDDVCLDVCSANGEEGWCYHNCMACKDGPDSEGCDVDLCEEPCEQCQECHWAQHKDEHHRHHDDGYFIPGDMVEGTCYCDCGQPDEGFFDDAFNGVGEFTEDTGDFAGDVFEDAQETSGDGLNDLGDALEDGIDTVSSNEDEESGDEDSTTTDEAPATAADETPATAADETDAPQTDASTPAELIKQEGDKTEEGEGDKPEEGEGDKTEEGEGHYCDHTSPDDNECCRFETRDEQDECLEAKRSSHHDHQDGDHECMCWCQNPPQDVGDYANEGWSNVEDGGNTVADGATYAWEAVTGVFWSNDNSTANATNGTNGTNGTHNDTRNSTGNGTRLF